MSDLNIPSPKVSLFVKPIEDTGISFKQYYDFIQDSYEERIIQGIPFVCTTLTVDELKTDIKKNGCQIFVSSLNKEFTEITSSISVAYRHNHEGKYAWFHLVASNKNNKRLGFGTQMLKTMIEKAKEEGCKYVLLSTAKSANSAVQFYLKNGFFIQSSHFPLRGGYSSYIFHYQITHPSKWDYAIYRKYQYIISDCKQTAKRLLSFLLKLINKICQIIINKKKILL